MNLLARRPVMVLIIIAAIVRGGVLWIGFDQLRDDPDAYDAIAQTLASTATFGVVANGANTAPTAFRPPLYPTILALIQTAIITTEEDLQDPLVSETQPVSRIAIAILHWLLSLATVVTTYFVAVRMLRSIDGDALPGSPSLPGRAEFPACFAALLVIIDPILIQSSVRVMTETLAALLAVGSLYCWCVLVEKLTPHPTEEAGTVRPSGGYSFRSIVVAAAGLGLVLGFAYLCRPTFIVWTALLLGYLMLRFARLLFPSWRNRSGPSETIESVGYRNGGLATALAAVTLAFIASMFVCGWTFRNQHHFGKPIWATTHGGYTLLLGNNPSFFRYMRSGSIGIAWDPQPFFDRWKMRDQADPRQAEFWESESPLAINPAWQSTLRESENLGELFEDRLAYETAKMAIANDTEGFVRATFWRVGRLLSPMPQVFPNASTGKRIGAAAVTIFYSVTGGLMIWGVFRLSSNLLKPQWIALIALVFSLVIVHAFYWSNMRMRAPAIPAMAILAAVPLMRNRI